MKIVTLALLGLLLTGAASAQTNPATVILTNSCTSGIKEACDIRAEAASPKQVIHMQEFFSNVCRMGTAEYPLTDSDEQAACKIRDVLTQSLKENGYRWDDGEQEWMLP